MEEVNHREKLLQLVAERKIRNTTKYIESATDEMLEKIYNDYQRKQLDETNEKIANILIKQVSGLMESLELVEDSESLKKDLEDNELLKRDVKNVLCFITPYIPYIGLACGGICISRYVWKKRQPAAKSEDG